MADDHEKHNEQEGETHRPDVFWLLSGVYCMLIVILSIVMCSSHYSTSDVTEKTVDVYFIILTLLGSIWLTTFRTIATSCGHYPNKHEEVRSSHSTNRWLKAILVIFGIAIIIKDILELLTTTEYTDAECKKPVYYLAPISEMVFIIAEVNFLFRYSKIHLQGHTTFNRFGAMHVMATNLSIWILIIIDESTASDRPTISADALSTITPTPFTSLEPTLQLAGCNTTELQNILNHSDTKQQQPSAKRFVPSTYVSEQLFGPKGCNCNTSYCLAVIQAHSYLYPFLVEFSLVASCMMYIVWKNVGVRPQHTDPPVKPSYKFYKSYKGLALGVIILIVTVVVLIFANYGIDENDSDGSYDDHVATMTAFNSYMVGAECLMLIACCVGVGLFRAEPRPLHVEVSLDSVLLLVTLAGVATMDMYYAFAVYLSLMSPNYEYKWIWGAVYPVVDLLQCIVQVGFILGGSARMPVVAVSNEKIEFAGQTHSIQGSSDSGIEIGYKNDVFESSDCEIPEPDNEDTTNTKSVIDKNDNSKMVDLPSSKRNSTLHSVSVITQIPKACRAVEANALKERIRQHELRPRVAAPTLTRLYIRDTVMFLLICNACLWMFWSLQGPDIKMFAYPDQYYSTNESGIRNLWRRASMFCLPLAIFFRMHSCACMFEIWSFA